MLECRPKKTCLEPSKIWLGNLMLFHIVLNGKATYLKTHRKVPIVLFGICPPFGISKDYKIALFHNTDVLRGSMKESNLNSKANIAIPFKLMK